MNKISKGKAVGLLSLGLASVALGSVGFASWVISTTQVNETENVAVTVGAISDQRITITAALNAGDPSVTLDAKDGQGAGAIKGSGSTEQDLTFKVDVTGKKGPQYGGTTYDCKFAVAFPGDIADGSYVTVASVSDGKNTITDLSNAVAVPVDEDPGAKTTYTFTLKWGTKFAGVNPALMTDKEITEDGGIDIVLGYLRQVQTAFSGDNKITVTLSSAA